MNLTASVRTQIDRLKRMVSEKASELLSLREQLRRHEKVYKFLAAGTKANRRRGRTAPGNAGRRRTRINWQAVFKSLPSPFDFNVLGKSRFVRGKPRVYLHQVVARWAKQGKVKRVGKGRYRKSQAQPSTAKRTGAKNRTPSNGSAPKQPAPSPKARAKAPAAKLPQAKKTKSVKKIVQQTTQPAAS